MSNLSRAAVLIGCMMLAAPAAATWNNNKGVIHGTANTLEQGEVIVGLLTPVAYGITDDWMVMIHPISWALLTPNAAVRYRALDHDIVRLAFHVEGAVTPLNDAEKKNNLDPRPLGHVTVGSALTFHVGADVLLTTQLSYRHDFTPHDDAFVFSGGVTWAFDPHHLLLLSGGAQYSRVDESVVKPTGHAIYAYAWDTWRLGGGVAFGDFPIVVPGKSKPVVLPAWPVIDVWARF